MPSPLYRIDPLSHDASCLSIIRQVSRQVNKCCSIFCKIFMHLPRPFTHIYGRKGGRDMAMAWIWTGMVTVSLVFAAVNGTMDAVSAAALEGAGAAVELCIAMAGVLCLWSGVMELMSRCGLSRKLAAALRPRPGAAAAPGQPGPGDSGGGVGQRVRQSAGPGQCRHTPGHPGGPAHGTGGRTAWPMTSCAAWWC